MSVVGVIMAEKGTSEVPQMVSGPTAQPQVNTSQAPTAQQVDRIGVSVGTTAGVYPIVQPVGAVQAGENGTNWLAVVLGLSFACFCCIIPALILGFICYICKDFRFSESGDGDGNFTEGNYTNGNGTYRG